VDGAVPELLLAAYCVTSENQAGLKKQQLQLKAAQLEQRGKVEKLRGDVESAEMQVGR
jgi:hypothetical protein